ncbi:MAG: histidine phosphatase family protein [Oscillospiraceae bacterium]|nr:histidine phosphatase family protein [Oscillospiraceae bacterium]
MTKVYFVRHAQPLTSEHDDRIRPLTEIGLRDSKAVSWLLLDRGISYIASSPYKRSVDTVAHFAELSGLDINIFEDLRERGAGGWHGGRFFEFIEKQWADFDYHIEDGECLREVQERNIRVLKRLLAEHNRENIVVATHGTALSTMLNYYFPQFDFECFKKIVDFMPFVIRLDFDGERCVDTQVELVIHKPYNKD